MKKLQTIILALSAIIAVITIIDFSFTGQTVTETALSSKAKFERYYNAGGNSHTSHSIHTKSYDFYASEDFQYTVKEHDTLQLKTSLLFNEINSATHLKSNTTETYSLRLYSGLIIPLLFLVALGVYYKFRDKVTIITFVLAVLNVANLVYLWF